MFISPYRVLLYTFKQPSTPCFVRLYGRWMHRNPAKILFPIEPDPKVSLKKEEVIILEKNSGSKHDKKDISTNKSDLKKEKATSFENIPKETRNKKKEILNKRNFYLSQKKVFDDSGEIIYEKLKENDGRSSTLLVRLKSKKERLRSGQILVEGWRLIVDGLEAKCILTHVIFSRIEDVHNLRPFLPKTGVTFYKVPYKEIEMWSDVETSPGIFGIFQTPTPENIKILGRPLPIRFICDNIRVPGNLGAILRAAAGVGCDKVLLTKGCVDVWDPKVIRSAAGAHFRLPIFYSIEWDEISKHLEEDTSVFIADSNSKISDDDDESEEASEGIRIPVLPYYGVEYATMKNITLVLGGETEGISEDSYRLAANRNGLRLNIPLQRGVDSLNTGMAAAVIAFEIRKQFIQRWARDKMERQVQYGT